MKKISSRALAPRKSAPDYDKMLDAVVQLVGDDRRTSARAVNALMTATYWMVGRHIVEYEQGGQVRAEYGEKLIRNLARDLTARCGRGFGVVNLSQMKKFYLLWPIC